MNRLPFTSNNTGRAPSQEESITCNCNNETASNDNDINLNKKEPDRDLVICETSDLSDNEEEEDSFHEEEDNESNNSGVKKIGNDADTSLSSLSSRKVVWRKWSQWTQMLHDAVNRAVLACSMCAARNPMCCIGSVLVLSFGLLGVGFFTNFNINVEETEIYAPFGSIPQNHFHWLNHESGFSQSTRATVLILHNHGDNVLGKDRMRRVFQALGTVRNTTGYREICEDGVSWDAGAKEFTCRIVSATRAWYHDADLFEEQVQTDQDVADALSLSEFPGGEPIDHAYILGNLIRDDPDDEQVKSMVDITNNTKTNTTNNGDEGSITYVPAYLVYILVSDKGDQTAELEANIIQNLFDLKAQWHEEDTEGDDDSSLQLDFFCERSFGDEFKRAIENDMYLVPAVFFIMSIFTCLVFLKRDRVQSRCMLGVGSITTIGMSLFSGFGIMFIFGVPYTSMTQLLPFLVFGVGLDDTFIITGEYLRTDPSLPAEDRIEKTMGAVGSSIMVTTLTTSAAFLLGLTSSVPAVHWLCLYAFPTIMIDFLYQITFFVAILVLDERRIKAQRKDCFICCTQSATEEEGGDYLETTSEEPTKHIADRAMAWYATQLMRPLNKAIVIVTFVLLFVFCVYRTTMLTQEFEVTELFPEGSYVTQAVENLHANQERTMGAGIYFRDVNQSNPIIQQQMIDFIEEISELPAYGAQPPLCWVRDFQTMKETELFETVADLSFGEQVQFALSMPAIKEAYGDDIVIDEEGNIVASRCRILAQNSLVEEVQDMISLLVEQRAVTNAQPINQGRKDEAFFTFMEMFLVWEFYAIAVEELIFTTLSSVLAVTGVALIFIPHWSAVFIVVPMVSIVYIDLLGVMQLVGLHINAVTYVCLVISVGLIVDFLMHIMLRYTESTQKSREGKVKSTLETMGASVLLGGLSTLLGILPLALSTSTIMKTVFTALCAMVILAVTHGLIFLPVVLSIVGPVPVDEATTDTIEERTTYCSDSSSWGSPKSLLAHSSSFAAFFSPSSKSEGKAGETVEQFLTTCADEIANDAFPDDPIAAAKETTDLLKLYIGIFQSTFDPSAFLAQLREEVSTKRKSNTIEDVC